VQISVAGGRRAVWGADGKQLYYWEGNRFMSATLSVDSVPAVLSRTALFSGRYEEDFDVSPDGTRFLMIQTESSGLSLVAVPHWRTELRRLTSERRGTRD
jgi:hypothetical protein